MVKNKENLLFTLIHDFLVLYLPIQKGASPHTIRSYQTSLDQLLDYVKEVKGITLPKITFDVLNSQTISKFLDYLETVQHCSIKTCNHRLACLRAFFSYAASSNSIATVYQLELQKVPTKRVPHILTVDYMSEEAIEILLAQPDTQTSKGIRDLFFMILLYDTGARIQELLDIRLDDIQSGTTPKIILHGKGGKTRIVPLMKKTMEHYQRYIFVFHKDRRNGSNPFLFYVNRNGDNRKMSPDNVRKFLRKYSVSANGICSDVPPNAHPHLWRHSRSMHLYQHGMDLTLIAQWLGHANLETTLIYYDK